MRIPFQRKPPASRWDGEGDMMEPPEPLVLPEPVNPGFYDPSWNEWEDHENKWGRRGIIALLVVAVLFAAVLVLKPQIKKALRSSSATTTTAVRINAAPTVYQIPHGAGQPQSVVFRGSKDVTTPAFSAPDGLAVINFDCVCDAGFSVTVNDSTGTAVAIPVNSASSGKQSGTVPASLAAGNYSAEISASGKWTVTFSFPTNAATLALPFTKSLIGPEVVGPFPSGQAMKIGYGAFYASSQNVSIRLMDPQGKIGQEIINTGALGGKQVVVPAQSTPFYVVADQTPGSWILAVSAEAGT